ncbi:MAG: NAD-dependent DNA ligase LigA [Candidatus Liptonbacteria bacterium]|nr:NAD-dependent DNA ligase LigA [Candidatus Liptonbacteria bacterium]
MDKPEAKKRVAKLREAIDRYRYSYHVLDKSLISDEALDSLKKELFDLEQSFPEFITPDSPTQRVSGKPLAEFKKVRHETAMISLNDAFSEEDMRAWFTRLQNYLGTRTGADKTPTNAEKGPRKSASSQRESVFSFYCDLKMDGLAVELVYENGILKQGSTRGDGAIGEDITQNLKTVEAIPLKLRDSATYPIPKKLVARGETFLNKKEFERMNREQAKKGEKLYANPRNVAAGSIRQLDPKITAGRHLDFYAYGLFSGTPKTHDEEYKLLREYGIKTNPYGKVVHSLKEVFEFHKKIAGKREKIPYEIDGIVVSLNDLALFEEAGVIGKAPRGAVAYKFSPREATTVVEDIQIQVGRTGALTPVAVMRKVLVGGVSITHASLHNADEIGRLGLKIGDTVIVSRAGDVIPQITKVLPEFRTGKEKAFRMPERCPVDGSKTVRDGVAYKCSNKICGARHKEQLYHFVSRLAFDIRGLGFKIIDRLLDEGLIVDAADIFTLQKGDIEVLERFGERSAEKITEEIAGRKTVSLRRFIYSLGILHVGEETAVVLAKAFGAKKNEELNVKDFLKFYGSLSPEKLQEFPDIGPKVAESIYGFFKEKRNLRLLEKLDRVGVKIVLEKPSAKSQKLAGLSFVLTGSLDSMSRENAKGKIRALGGDVSESVSKNTSYLVAGEEPGSKYNKAKELGVKVIGEKEFLKILG